MGKDLLANFWDEIEEIDGFTDTDTMDEYAGSLHYEAARALACCINENGCVNFPWMTRTSGLSTKELQDGLKGAIFQDPKGYDLHHSDEEDWLLRVQYINGNNEEKLSTAKRMNRKYKGRFAGNIHALKKARPQRIHIDEIGISIGSSWIPDYYYAQFAKEILGIKETPEVIHSAELGRWKINASDDAKKTFNNCRSFGCCYMVKGEEKCLTMLQILERTLNGITIRISEQIDSPKRKSGKAYVILKNETIAAQEKQELLEETFKKWVKSNPSRVKRLEEAFYDTFACLVPGRYDGSFLTLPGLNPEFVPYSHQRNAVARIILEKDVLLCHAVGTGKTSILIMGIHERYRMGLSGKNLVVVPNNVLEAFERTHHFLYPDDRILVIKPEDFTPADRQAVLERIRDKDYVAVYMAFSSFDLIKMSRQYYLDLKTEEIRSLRARAAVTADNWEQKRILSEINRLSKDYEKAAEELPADTCLPFEELGITTLTVDEVHFYKNVTLHTSADDIVGMHAQGSRKSNSLMEKAQYVRSNGGSLLFSTGTPLTNSISDLFVLQMFLQPEQLKLLHLRHFDEWLGTFADRKPCFEVDLDSRNYRIMTRFSRFHNLPELKTLFSEVCDFYNGDEISGLPLCEDYIDTVVSKSAEQEELMTDLGIRLEMVRAGLVDPHEDNYLKIVVDGHTLALDPRLLDKRSMHDPRQTKVFACAKNVYKWWHDYPGTAQLVFCDLGTPKKDFNIYDELKEHLIRMGIPPHQIAFVHSAATNAERRKLFKAVNKANIRVLIGSTSKLGTGVNVQENLIAIHHLDVPWRPSDISQREGRLIRQGNNNKKVFRFRYITSGTFDSYSWQILENKQRFIGQFMAGELADRDTRDIDDTLLSYAEIKALCVGDPLLKTRIETGNELEIMKIHSRQRERELRNIEIIVNSYPNKTKQLAARRDRLLADQKYFEENRESLTKQERSAFGEELLYELSSSTEYPSERIFDTLHGFRVLLPAGMSPEKPKVILSGVSGNRYDVNMQDAKESGCIQRIEYILLHLQERVHAAEKEIAKAEKELTQAKKDLEQGNPYKTRAVRLNKELLDIDFELKRRAEEIIA